MTIDPQALESTLRLNLTIGFVVGLVVGLLFGGAGVAFYCSSVGVL